MFACVARKTTLFKQQGESERSTVLLIKGVQCMFLWQDAC